MILTQILKKLLGGKGESTEDLGLDLQVQEKEIQYVNFIHMEVAKE